MTITTRHFTRFASLLATAVIASSVHAQVAVRVVAHTTLTAGSKTIPANTNVTTGVSLSDRNNGLPCVASAGLLVNVSSTGPSVRFGCSSFSFCSSAPSAGGSIRISLTSSTPVSGLLLVKGDCPGSRSVFSIDVHNDGTKELEAWSQFRGERLLETPIEVDASGVDIVVDGSAFLLPVTSSSASLSVTVEFSPLISSTHLRPIGTPCGPELTPRFTQTQPFFAVRNFTIDVKRVDPSANSWFIVGLRELNIPIPPLGCRLYTDALVLVSATVDPAGNASLHLPVPSGLTSAQAIVQLVSWKRIPQGQLLWSSSQAAQLRL